MSGNSKKKKKIQTYAVEPFCDGHHQTEFTRCYTEVSGSAFVSNWISDSDKQWWPSAAVPLCFGAVKDMLFSFITR